MATTTYAQASSDLQASVGAQIAAGNAAWASANYPSAVIAFQSAGQQGAATIGPEIDAVGYPQVTQKYTQQAWSLNGTLATIDSTTAVQTDALEAQTLANKIMQLYTQAISAGQAAANPPPPSNLPIWLALGGLAVAGGLILGLHARKVGSTRTSQRPTRRVSSSAATRRMSQAVTRRV
jgi:hypothetical protein